MTGAMADVRIGLMGGLGNKKAPQLREAVSILEQLYQSDNICYKFLALKLWSDYHKTKKVYDRRIKSSEDKEYLDTYFDRIEDLTLPFRYSIENEITTWQCDNPKHPMHLFSREYYKYPCGLLWASNLKNDE